MEHVISISFVLCGLALCVIGHVVGEKSYHENKLLPARYHVKSILAYTFYALPVCGMGVSSIIIGLVRLF